ncbi:MAG: helicase-related protein [Prochloraceae cyanobacterium]|nr:helicase-related protein [Prochloraceae cyanobacterium]
MEKLDIAALRAASKKTIKYPDWLVVGKTVYSPSHKSTAKVTAIIGTVAQITFGSKTEQVEIANLEPAPNNSSTYTEINLGAIEHIPYRTIATDYVSELSKIQVLEGNEPHLAPLPANLNPHLKQALNQCGIKQFYSHQLHAWDVLRANGSIAIVTPTASGKSMAFMPQVFQLALEQKRTSLLIYPLRALALDQYNKLLAINSALPEERQLLIARCTGDVPLDVRKGYFRNRTSPPPRGKGAGSGERGDISSPLHPAPCTPASSSPPDIIVISPDVLHHLLFHTKNSNMALWQEFLSRLAIVVCDESHTYTSSFGMHFANVLRRLRLAVFNSKGNPKSISWVVATATIANPKHLASTFTGLPESEITLIDRSGAKTHQRTFLILKPQPAPNYTAVALISSLLLTKLNGLVFVNSRATAKNIFSLLTMQMGSSSSVDLFYGSLTSSNRKQIIERLNNGSLRILITTSALEAGIDLPNLDFVVLRGTSSINSLWQRAGRAGRSSPGLVMLVPDTNNHIDYYYGNYSDRLFDKAETVKIQANYPAILARHLLCAGAEGGMHNSLVPQYFGSGSEYIAAELLKQNQLFWSRNGNLWKKGYPHKEFSLRGMVNDSIQLIDADNGQILEEMQLNHAHRECHTGAIYISASDGTTLASRCEKLSIIEKKAVLKKLARDDLRTRPDVELEVHAQKRLDEPKVLKTAISGGNIRLSLWWGRVSEIVSGYSEFEIAYGYSCQNPFCEEYRGAQPPRRQSCMSCGSKLSKQLTENKLDDIKFDEPLISSFEAPILRIEVNDCLGEAIDDKGTELRKELVEKYNGQIDAIPPLEATIIKTHYVAIALHSLSHMLIKAIPLVFLASSADVSSLTSNRNASASGNANKTVVYLYDNISEGCGTSEAIFSDISLVVEKATELTKMCDCGQSGCPRCLTLHGCPELNENLSKSLGLWLLENIE